MTSLMLITVQTKFAFLQFMNSIISLLQSTPEISSTQIEELQERVDIIRHKLKYVESRPTVLCIECLEPLMVSANWMPETVSIAGGSSLLAEANKHSPNVKWEDIQQANPEIMVVMLRGSSIDRTMRGINLLLMLPGFNHIRAVKNNRFYIADGNQYFYNPGPNIVDSIEIMAEIIHPKLFSFGYEGDAWIKFSL